MKRLMKAKRALRKVKQALFYFTMIAVVMAVFMVSEEVSAFVTFFYVSYLLLLLGIYIPVDRVSKEVDDRISYYKECRRYVKRI